VVRHSRGRHLANVLPLLTGRAYIEFRHLSSKAFFRDPERAVRLAEKAVSLLSDPPRGRMTRHLQSVVLIADRISFLGGSNLREVVAGLPAATELHRVLQCRRRLSSGRLSL
jgi:hypothetical protein